MYNVAVSRVPVMDWMTSKAKKIVEEFNNSGKKLTLSFFEEPENEEQLEFMLEDGRYDFLYPDCPEAIILKDMIDELEKVPKFLCFEMKDLM